MNKDIALPRPIARYLQAVNTGDVDGFPSSFAEDAVVEDVQRKIRGLAAIKEWSRHDIFGVEARLDVVKVFERDGRTVLTIKIDGTFDRTGLPDPLLMDHAFKVVDGKVVELKVTFATDHPGRAGAA